MSAGPWPVSPSTSSDFSQLWYRSPRGPRLLSRARVLPDKPLQRSADEKKPTRPTRRLEVEERGSAPAAVSLELPGLLGSVESESSMPVGCLPPLRPTAHTFRITEPVRFGPRLVGCCWNKKKERRAHGPPLVCVLIILPLSVLIGQARLSCR